MESCLAGNLGATIDLDPLGRPDSLLFGEAPGRVLVSVPADRADELEDLLARYVLPHRRLGVVGGARLVWKQVLDLGVDLIRREHERGFDAIVKPSS